MGTLKTGDDSRECTVPADKTIVISLTAIWGEAGASTALSGSTVYGKRNRPRISMSLHSLLHTLSLHLIARSTSHTISSRYPPLEHLLC